MQDKAKIPNDGRTIDDAPDAVTAGPGLWDQNLIDILGRVCKSSM